jgi:hypothetical protein
MKKLLMFLLLLIAPSLYSISVYEFDTMSDSNIVIRVEWDKCVKFSIPNCVIINNELGGMPKKDLLKTLLEVPKNSIILMIIDEKHVMFELIDKIYILSYNKKGSIISYCGENENGK